MASIRKQIKIRANPDHVWDAVRDFGAVHMRLVAGFVTDCATFSTTPWTVGPRR